MLHLKCDNCHTMTFTERYDDPDSELQCGCCPEDHHHGQAAENGEPCRPMTITVVPGSGPVLDAGA